MLSRTSKVNHLFVYSMLISSFLQIGDSTYVNGLSRALAVQRQAEIFYDYEGEFSQFSIFNEVIPLPLITEEVVYQKVDMSPAIQVGNIRIIGVSTSSGVHIGNSGQIYMESRIKHIRQLLHE
ncbi:spore germination protein GerPE [Pseudoneobacillus sp. C159]